MKIINMDDHKNSLKIPQVEARSYKQWKQTSWIILTCKAKKKKKKYAPYWVQTHRAELNRECSSCTGSLHTWQLQKIKRWREAIWKEGSPPPPTQISIHDILKCWLAPWSWIGAPGGVVKWLRVGQKGWVPLHGNDLTAETWIFFFR